MLMFLLFAFTRVFLRLREGTISPGMFLFWSGIWILASVGVIEPGFTTWVANRIGIGRGVDAIIYISLLLLFYLMYRTNVFIENLRHEITELTRKIALEQKNELKQAKKNRRKN